MVLTGFLIFIICSVAGWIWEVMLSFLCYGTFINRGMLYGPWIPIYGVGALLIYGIAVVVEQPWQIFVISAAACGFLEYATSVLMELIWKMRWWNYTGIFSVHGRINLLVIALFGSLGLLTSVVIEPWIQNITKPKAPVLLLIVGIILLCIAVDFGYSQVHPNLDGITTEAFKSNHHQV